MILIDDGSRREKAYEIWQRNFHDPILYADFYYKEVYGKNQVYYHVDEEGRTYHGMLHLNPYGMVVRGQHLKAHYIVGVSTEEEYRRQGVMRDLLKKSLNDMREEGEAFTYLMPADQAYYLPFDFRFGMKQFEQEIHYEQEDWEPDARFTFYEWKEYPEDGPSIEDLAREECLTKEKTFALFTEITADYLTRLHKEIESEYGKLVLVFRDGRYYGRFAAAEEYSYLILSRFFCMGEKDEKRAFIRMALHYCLKNFGDFGDYQVILDESWQEAILPYGKYGSCRIMPVKEVKKIMFRILNLEAMAPYIRLKGMEEDKSFYIKVTDPFIEDNSGGYEFKVHGDMVDIRRLNRQEQEVSVEKCSQTGKEGSADSTDCLESVGEKASADSTDRLEITREHVYGKRAADMDYDTEISIADLTSVIWGDQVSDHALLSKIVPLRKSCVMEIV